MVKSYVDVKEKIDNLVRILKYYNIKYYRGEEVITNQEYDSLLTELEELEKKHPHLIRDDSPTQLIYQMSSNEKEVEHKPPMLSVRSTYSYEELKEEIEKLLKNSPLIVEGKIDGISASINYEKSIVNSLSLRGNGYFGEDITHHINNIHNIPLEIPSDRLEIRGEIFLPKEFWSSIKENRRNYAAGRLNTKQLNKSELKFIPYQVLGLDFKEDSNSLEWLSKYFEVIEFKILKELKDIDNIIEYFKNKDFDYETDGIVFKVNNIEKRNDLGSTSKYPRGIIAYKYHQDIQETTVEEIQWQIKRNGLLNPVCILKPITTNFSKANISRVNGHNKKYLQENSIGKGSVVLINRVGNVIPKIERVVVKSDDYKISICPYCKSPLIEEEIDYRCPNSHCKGVLTQRCLYLFKRIGLEGIGEGKISNILLKVANVFELLPFLYRGEWVSDLNDKKVLRDLFKIIKVIEINELIIALGVEGIGEKTPLYFSKWEDIFNLSEENNFSLQNKRLKSLIDFININKKELIQLIDFIKEKKSIIEEE